MLKTLITSAALLAGTAAFAQDAAILTQAPPPAPYQAVSDLVDLPEFLPGLGQLFVDPATLPAGPFLGYDHDGRLSATIYMTPLADLEGGTAYNDLGVGSETVSGVDIYYNAGHPGVEEPHAHVVLYHDAEAKSRLAQVMTTRRHILALGGGGLAILAAPPFARAAMTEVIEMSGTARGEHVWFRPQGLAVAPGTTLRFVNRDWGNSHTATAYHPDLYGRSRRIPEGATPWDSGLLLPDESFEVTPEQPGVYDYYCQPHEMAGMVGRIVVGEPRDAGWEGASSDAGDLPAMALAAFPSAEAILAAGRVDVEGHT